MDEKTIARFWAKVDVLGPEECWMWKAGTDKDGYGKFYKKGTDGRAHRIAYELCKGESASGSHVLHSCDTPGCCNGRSHLRLGTILDNNRDRRARGKYLVGADHFLAVLTNETALLAYARVVNDGETVVSVARSIGIQPASIYAMLKGKTWKHLNLAPVPVLHKR
jgi:hypothetical protein